MTAVLAHAGLVFAERVPHLIKTNDLSLSATWSSARDTEPIVVSGAELPALSGRSPDDVFVFRFDPGAGWRQIPRQVDERRTTELLTGSRLGPAIHAMTPSVASASISALPRRSRRSSTCAVCSPSSGPGPLANAGVPVRR